VKVSRLMFSWICVTLVLCASLGYAEEKQTLETPQDVAAYLQEISVTIKAGYAEGSGTAIVRKIDGEEVTFVWTAAHVVDGLRKEKTVVTPDGTKRTKVVFDDCSLVQEVRQDGRRVGEWKFDARVLRFSAEEDLSLLMVRKRGLLEASARFYLEDEIPAVGTELYHCGSPGGQSLGANSVTSGILSQIGRTFPDEIGEFDQATVACLPGSSGGGVFNVETGEYLGMLTMGIRGQDSFAYFVPVRRIAKWCENTEMEWAVDEDADTPTLEELRKMHVEDVGNIGKFGEASVDEKSKDRYHLIRTTEPEISL